MSSSPLHPQEPVPAVPCWGLWPQCGAEAVLVWEALRAWDASEGLSSSSSVGKRCEILAKGERHGESLRTESRLEPGCVGLAVHDYSWCFVKFWVVLCLGEQVQMRLRTQRLCLEGEKVVFMPRQAKNLLRRAPRQDVSAFKNTVWCKSAYLESVSLPKVSAVFWVTNQTKQIPAPITQRERESMRLFRTS